MIPQPRDDPSVCENLVGQRVDLQLSDRTVVRVNVVACEPPYLRGHAPFGMYNRPASVDTLTYDLREVDVVAIRTKPQRWFLITATAVGIAAVLAFLVAVVEAWNGAE